MKQNSEARVSSAARGSTRISVGSSLAALALLLSIVLPAGSAGASEEPHEKPKPKTAKVEAVGQWAYSRLTRAHEALGEERYDDAIAELEEMKRGEERLNSHERAMLWQTYGFVQASRGLHEEAAASFERCLSQHGLPPSAQVSTQSNLAQIYLMIGEYEKAIENFEVVLAEQENPTAQAHYMLALAYAQGGDDDKALPQAEQAVAKSEQPHEGRLQLLSALYFRDERYDALVPVLSALVEHFPKKSYWIQLSAIYAELGRTKEALGAQEAAYEQGLLTEHREYVTLARLFMQNAVPFEAAKILEEGFDAGVVEPTREAWALLASGYLQAREYDDAAEPLREAAKLDDSGEGFVRLAELHLNRYQWGDARKALRSAVGKGSLEDPGLVQLLIGIASAGEGRYEEAKRAFENARDFDKHAQMAKQWLDHVEREMSIAAAEAAANAGSTASSAATESGSS